MPRGDGVDASDCVGRFMREKCVVRCLKGYEGPSEVFRCNEAGVFVPEFSTGSMPTCVPKACTYGLPKGVEGLDVGDCAGKTLGQGCFVSCSRGYYPARGFFTCSTGGRFVGQAPFCRKIVCDADSIPRAIGVNISDCEGGLRPNQTCTLTCQEGFEDHALPWTCGEDGHLRGQVPDCIHQACAVPSSFSDVSVVHDCGAEIINGEACVATCAKGYNSALPVQYVCEAPAQLGAAPACQANTCSRLYPFGPGLLQASCPFLSLKTGDSCSPACATGFEAKSPGITCSCGPSGALMKCQAFGCRRARCGDIGSVAGFGTMGVVTTCQRKVFGQACVAYCGQGFSQVLPEDLFCAMTTGTAATQGFVDEVGSAAAAPSCQGKECTKMLPTGLGLGHDCLGKTTGQTCSTFALPGFEVAESAALTCSPSGALVSEFGYWISLKRFRASPRTCPEPSLPVSVAHTCSGKAFGGVCWAYCRVGYSGVPVELRCTLSGGNVELQYVTSAPSCTSARRLMALEEDGNDTNDTDILEFVVGDCSGDIVTSGLAAPGVKHNCASLSQGEVCLAECEDGYDIVGAAQVFSCDNASLIGSAPSCQARTCTYNLPDGIGVTHNCSSRATGSSCVATCDAGYKLPDGASPKTWQCLATGEFEGSPVSCEPLPCPAVELSVLSAKGFQLVEAEGTVEAEAGYIHDCSGKVTGESCLVTCADGFSPENSSENSSARSAVLSCEASGYSGTIPLCLPDMCTGSVPSGADLTSENCSGLLTNEVCTVSCSLGYSGEPSNFTCTGLGDIEGQRPTCIPEACSIDFSVPAGINILECDEDSLALGATCGTSCKQGYLLKPGTSLTILECSWNSSLNKVSLQGALPTCVAQPCTYNIPSGASIEHNCDGIVTDKNCTASCAPGNEAALGGSETSVFVCGGNGVLVGDDSFNCTGKTCPERPELGTQSNLCQDLVLGSTCWMYCAEGYSSVVGATQWSCAVDAGASTVSLQGASPDCQPLPCLHGIPIDLHLSHDCDGIVYQESCEVWCNEGYGYFGTVTNMTCGADQRVTGPLPECILVTTSSTTSTTTSSITVTSTNTSTTTGTSTTTTSSVLVNFTDTVEYQGVFSMNVSDPESFVNETEAVSTLKNALAAAYDVPFAYISTVTLSLNPIPPPTVLRRLAEGDGPAPVYVSYTVILSTQEAMAVESNQLTMADLEPHVTYALQQAAAFGAMASYTVSLQSVVESVVIHTCGDGIRLGYENDPGRCDDGNTEAGDGCDETCYVETGAYCNQAGEPCTSICGDGLVAEFAEECDDGNNEPYDFCGPDCKIEYGRCAVQAVSACTKSSVVRTDVSQFEFCADYNCTWSECCRMKQAPLGLSCELGGFCTPICGDGILKGDEADAGRCDDGNNESGDGCSSTCYVEPGWTCSGINCFSVCGDSILAAPAEECDDGNTDPGDGCGPNCRWDSGVCAVQAEGLCSSAPGYIIRPLNEELCYGPICTLDECCVLVELGDCPVLLDGRLTTGCEDGSGVSSEGQKSSSGPSRSCSLFTCPGGWEAKDPNIVATCITPLCELATCCRPLSVTCTCEHPECCAPLQAPPEVIDGGSVAGLKMTLVAPLTPFINGTARWYYYLSRGMVTHELLSEALGGAPASKVNRGYRLTLPGKGGLEALEALFRLSPEPRSPDPRLWPNDDFQPLQMWTNIEQSPGEFITVYGNLQEPIFTSTAQASDSKLAFLNAEEVFTVWHGSDELRRMELFEGVSCCRAGHATGTPGIGLSGTLQGVPKILQGATFFALTLDAKSVPGTFHVMVQEPSVVFAVCVIDPYRQYSGQLDSDFDKLGWQEEQYPNFRLQPFGLLMGVWRKSIDVGSILQVPHAAGLRGAVALQAASELLR